MRDHRRLMRLRAAREHGRHCSNPKATADVPHQVEDAGCVADLLVTERAGSQHRKRHKYKPHRETAEDLRPCNAADRDLQIDIAEHVRRYADDEETEHDQITTVDLSD